MVVTLELPEDLAQLLGPDAAGLSQVALEALAAEAVRSNKLSIAQARRLLAIASRYEMDGFLKAHGLLFSTTIDDVKNDAETALSFRIP